MKQTNLRVKELKHNTMKWLQLLRFIRKHRKAGLYSFHILTTADEIIITTRVVMDKQNDYDHEQIRFRY